MAGGVAASGSRVFSKFLKPQASDLQPAAMWGVAATTGALWLIQGLYSSLSDGIRKCYSRVD